MFVTHAALTQFDLRARLRRRAHALLLPVLLALSAQAPGAAAPATVTAARVWPAQDYTRITFESAAPLQFQLTALKNPERLALDIEIGRAHV